MNKRGLPQTVRMKHDLHYVEELFHGQTDAVGKYIPIDLIKPNPDQPRQHFGDLSELVASIREKGVLEPLLVRPIGPEYQIIAGERRWRACKELGIPMIPCIEKNVDDREVLELALIENLQRKDLTPFEEADGLKMLADRYEYTHAQIAQVIGKSRTSVTECLSLNQIPAEVKAMCREADISSKSLLLQVVRQPDVQSMKELVSRIKKENLTRQDVREAKQVSSDQSEPFLFRFNGSNFKLRINFNKAHVTPEEILLALKEALENLK